MPPAGLEAVFLANRDRLLRFLLVRGAGDAAEDLLQDLWIRISASATGPVINPVAYLFRAADMLMIDRYRSRKRSEQRERDWMDSDGAADGDASLAASSEREIGARQELARVAAVLKALGPRRETVFRRARIDGISQPRIAEELGVSLSTVESDLRTACRALAELRETLR